MHFTYWDRVILTNPFQDHPSLRRRSWVIHFPLRWPLCSPLPYPYFFALFFDLIPLWIHLTYQEERLESSSQFFFTHVSSPFSDSFPFFHIFPLLLIFLSPFLQIPTSSPFSEPLECLWFISHNLMLITVSSDDVSLHCLTRSYFTHRQGSSLFTALIISKFPNADQIVCCLKSSTKHWRSVNMVLFLLRYTRSMTWVWQSS